MRNSVDYRFTNLIVRAGLAAGIAITLFALPPLNTKAAPAEGQRAATTSVNLKDGTLYLGWSGQIAPGITDFVRNNFTKYATGSHRVILLLNSGGGQVEEGERLIHVLEQIKQTHRFGTAVQAGRLCGSMCLPVFLAGIDRFAAPASLWLFHEVVRHEADGTARIDAEETQRLFRQYYLPAGVSTKWLKTIMPKIKNVDLWQTGADLISAKTGVITLLLENRTERALPAPPSRGDRGANTPNK